MKQLLVCLVSLYLSACNAQSGQLPPGAEEGQEVLELSMPATPRPSVQETAARELPCPDDAAKALARAYMLSVPIVEGRIELEIGEHSRLVQFVRSNALFASTGTATRCARLLGVALARQGTMAYDSRAGDRVIEQWGSAAPEIAADVARDVQRDLNAGANSLVMLGAELAWLANVLPDVAQGSLTSFNAGESASRAQLKQALPMMQMLNQVDPKAASFMRAEMDKAMKQYSSAFEQQMLVLAQALNAQYAQ